MCINRNSIGLLFVLLWRKPVNLLYEARSKRIRAEVIFSVPYVTQWRGLFEPVLASVKVTSLHFLCRMQYSVIDSSAGPVHRFSKEANLLECTPCCSMTVCCCLLFHSITTVDICLSIRTLCSVLRVTTESCLLRTTSLCCYIQSPTYLIPHPCVVTFNHQPTLYAHYAIYWCQSLSLTYTYVWWWPGGLRRGSVVSGLLGLRVPIQPGLLYSCL